MTQQFSTTIRNDWLDRYEVTIGTDPIMEIRTTAPPANCAAADAGVVLATLTLPTDWMAAASGGSKVKAGSWADSSADASGTPGHFRIKDSTGTTTHHQGTCGTSGTDMILDAATLTAGQQFTVVTFTLTAPGA